MSNFPETLGLGQIISREFKEEIERRYNTYVELEQQLTEARVEVEHLRQQLANNRTDAERYQWLIDNSFNRVGVDQLHVWVHTWETDSATGELTEWKSQVRGPAIDRAIDKLRKAQDHE